MFSHELNTIWCGKYSLGYLGSELLDTLSRIPTWVRRRLRITFVIGAVTQKHLIMFFD
jgi:hypothetical protein